MTAVSSDILRVAAVRDEVHGGILAAPVAVNDTVIQVDDAIDFEADYGGFLFIGGSALPYASAEFTGEGQPDLVHLVSPITFAVAADQVGDSLVRIWNPSQAGPVVDYVAMGERLEGDPQEADVSQALAQSIRGVIAADGGEATALIEQSPDSEDLVITDLPGQKAARILNRVKDYRSVAAPGTLYQKVTNQIEIDTPDASAAARIMGTSRGIAMLSPPQSSGSMSILHLQELGIYHSIYENGYDPTNAPTDEQPTSLSSLGANAYTLYIGGEFGEQHGNIQVTKNHAQIGIRGASGNINGFYYSLSGGYARASVTDHMDVTNPASTQFMPIEASAFNVGSDRKVKKNITAPDFDVLQALRDAPNQSWEYINGDGERRIGPMANDLPEQLTKQMSPDGPYGEHLGVDTSDMIGALWGACQQLLGQVESLTDRVEALEAQVANQ